MNFDEFLTTLTNTRSAVRQQFSNAFLELAPAIQQIFADKFGNQIQVSTRSSNIIDQIEIVVKDKGDGMPILELEDGDKEVGKYLFLYNRLIDEAKIRFYYIMPCVDISELHFKSDTYDALLNHFSSSDDANTFVKLEKSYSLFVYPVVWDNVNQRNILPTDKDSPFREQYPKRCEYLYSTVDAYTFESDFLDKFELEIRSQCIRDLTKSKFFVCFCIYKDIDFSCEGDLPNIAKEIKRLLKPFGTTEFYLALQHLGKVSYKDLNYK